MDSVVGKFIIMEKKRIRGNTFTNNERDLSINIRNKDKKVVINE